GVRIEHDGYPRDCGRDLLEQLPQFGAHRGFQIREAGDVAARFGKAVHEATADRIGDLREDDWDRPGLRVERGDHRGSMADDQIELQLDELACESADSLGIARAPAVLDPDVAPAAPAELLHASVNADTRDCRAGSLSAMPMSTPMRRMRSPCARAASGQPI